MCCSCNANSEKSHNDKILTHYTDDMLVYDVDNKNPVSKAALSIVDGSIIYDGSYRRIDYPMGDVPDSIGVCTDVIIRTYRELGVDLQELIFIDMTINPEYYSEKPDKNISHRRVPNMQSFFSRKAEVKSKKNKQTFKPGDIVTWDFGPKTNHIGIVVDSIGPSGYYMVVHNIGSGQNMDDCLFNWPIKGHFYYSGRRL